MGKVRKQSSRGHDSRYGHDSHDSRDAEQVKSRPATAREIMRTQAFQKGVADMRAGRGYRGSYECSGVDAQWDYERGRAWALLAGPHVRVADARGEPTPAAVKIFDRAGDLIL